MQISFPDSFCQYAITIDFDWAPDFAIKFVAEILIKNKIKATWFITQDTPVIELLQEHPKLFEIGIHPNFMPGTNQGDDEDSILENLIKIVPDAKSIRTHGLYQTSNLLKKFVVNFGLKNDVSVFMRQTPFLMPFTLNYGEKNLIRIPYFWAEEEEMSRKYPFKLHERYAGWKGLKIFNFHPIHIYLNSANVEIYNNIKKTFPYPYCSENEIHTYINKHISGTKDFLHQLINLKTQQNIEFLTINEIAEKYLKYIKNSKLSEY